MLNLKWCCLLSHGGPVSVRPRARLASSSGLGRGGGISRRRRLHRPRILREDRTEGMELVILREDGTERMELVTVSAAPAPEVGAPPTGCSQRLSESRHFLPVDAHGLPAVLAQDRGWASTSIRWHLTCSRAPRADACLGTRPAGRGRGGVPLCPMRLVPSCGSGLRSHRLRNLNSDQLPPPAPAPPPPPRPAVGPLPRRI